MYQILLLYDEPGEADRVKDYLQLSGCEVVENALEEKGKYRDLIGKADAVVLYYKMEPDCEVCGQIRFLTMIPIIVLSGEADEWKKIKMFQAGADDYLVEPIQQGELVARLKTHVERFKRLTRPFGYIEVRGLFIDAFSRQVILDGEEVILRAKEFDILLYLAQRPNKAVSKQEIYSMIWDDDLGERYYNSVAVHIKRIRQKIEADPENPKFVETVWGIGYRFRVEASGGI